MGSPENAAVQNSILTRLARRFHAARRGNVAVMTAVLMMPIMGLMGLAVDYGNAVFVKSRLDQAAQAAATAAATAARNWVQSADRTAPGYNQNTVDANAAAEGKDIGVKIFKAQFGDVSNGTWNAPTVSVTRVSNTFTAQVVYSATLNTYFARIWPINLNTFNLKGQRTIIVGTVDTPAAGSGAAPNGVIDEKWVTVDAAVQTSDPTKPVINDWYSGTPGSASPLNPSAGLLRNGAQDTPPSAYIQVGGAVNGAAVAPIISKKVFLQVGTYELRYWYKSTVVYPDYEPVYICGSVEGEMHWATAIATRSLASSRFNSTTNTGAQTARAGAYLVPVLTNPQLATTPPVGGRMKQDGTVSLPNDFPQPPALPWSASNSRADNSRNRVDICVYSSRWIQRSVFLTVSDAGYFWLSFVAEPPTKTTTPTNTSSTTIVNTINGFYLGRVQLCDVQCSETLNTNNWPWAYGTNLFTADFTSGSPGLTFNNSGSGTFGSNALYETTTPWTVRVFGGLRGYPADSQPLYVYRQNDKGVGPSTIVTSNRSSAYLYRGLLLTAGTYRATFTIGTNASSAGGPNRYCSFSSATVPQSNIADCGCYVGDINPNIAHGDQIAATGLTTRSLDSNTARTVAGYYSRPYTVGSVSGGSDDDTGTADSTNGLGYLLGNCWSSPNPKTFTYCFLVPRTQYYGINFRTAGPQLDTNPVQLASSPYPELRLNPPDLTLGTGGARVYSLTIDVLSQGLKNNINLDFPTYLTDCDKSLSGNSTPSLANVMASGTPVWPGVDVAASAYSTAPVRVAVKAPLQ